MVRELNNNLLEPILFKRLDFIRLSSSKYLVTSFIDFLSFASLLVYCHLLLQDIEDLTNYAYPKMINLETDLKCPMTFTSFLFDAGQEVIAFTIP